MIYKRIDNPFKRLPESRKQAIPQRLGYNMTPASSGDSMSTFIEWINKYSTLRPQNVFEIGANMAQDAEALQRGFGIKNKNVWVFEPHPDLFNYIKSHYSYNTFQEAVLDRNTDVVINAIDLKKNTNSGISSIRKHLNVPESNFKKIKVKGVRMDKFVQEHKIKSIDFLKLDVEGANYEVLVGFGKELHKVKSLHVESEHVQSWQNEKLWEDIRPILEKHFELVFFQRYYTQSDSFWVRREYLKGEPNTK